MKTRNIILAFLAAASAMCFQSCLFEQEEVFEETSSERMQNYLENTKKTLTSKDYWILDYFRSKGQADGGYTFVVKFTDKEVTAASEMKPEEFCTSLYKLTTDNGPVLTFDTNNEALHYFATPSSAHYEAKGGDFEFTIMKVSDEEVILKGKRSGNYCYLRPMMDGGDAAKYISDVAAMAADVHAATFSGTIGGEDFPVHGKLDLNKRNLKFMIDTEEKKDSIIATLPFSYTPEGIRGYETACINGCHFRDLRYLSQNNVLTNSVFSLQCAIPEDYTDILDFIGNFKLYYNQGSSVNVAISMNEDGTLSMSGLNKKLVVTLTYDKALGRLDLATQIVGTEGNNTIYFCGWGIGADGSGYLTYAEGVGMSIHRDMTTEGRFLFSDNGVWEDDKVNSFILYLIDLNADDKFIGAYSGWGTDRFPHVTHMDKIN